MHYVNSKYIVKFGYFNTQRNWEKYFINNRSKRILN
jgi:hypothetical protein